MSVYFVQAAGIEAIKIGHASDVVSRLANMQIGCPTLLTLLAVAEGGKDYERQLHKRFETYRIRGEWFSPGDDLLAFMETLPKPEITTSRRGPRTEPNGHPLDSWLHKNGVGRKAFGTRIGVSPSAMTDLCNGKIWVRARVARAIERETGGDVKVGDLLQNHHETGDQGATDQ